MSPPPNWDDDFDFQDQAPKKKPAQKKKVIKDTEFFDDEDNTNKLPSISSKNIIPKQPVQNKRTSARQNPYAQNMKLRGNIYDDDINDDLDDQPKIKPNNKAYKDSSNKKKQVQQEVEFYQELDDQPKKQVKKDKKPSIIKKEQPPKIQPEEEQNYQQQVYQDAYGQDFQEIQQIPKEVPKKAQLVINTDPQKKKQVISLNNKNDTSLNNQKKVPPKPPSRSSLHQKNQAPNRNFTVQKSNKINIARSGSRQSLKSAESKRANQSRVNNKLNTNLSFIPNKYTTEIDKAFPDDVNLNQLNQDKVNKMNEKLRAMIKKFNEELNELINKNMMYLKSKKQQKSPSIQNKLRVLEQQSKNNETMIEVMQKQFDKLSGRDGELRQQEYQLLMQKKIEEAKQQIKQYQKNIVKLKTEIKSQGNKLTNKNEDKKLAAQLHHLKTTLIQSKKDEQKQTQKVEKLDEQMQDLNQKIIDIDYKLGQLIDQAKQKGIQLQSKQQLIKKYEMTKKKVEVSRNHRAKLQNLLRTKSDIVSHQKQQLKINIKNNEMQIKNLYDSISHVHNQSVKVVQKAKTNPKLSPNILNDLDSILKSLELIPLDSYSVRSEENRSQASQRPPLKSSDTSNMQKSQPQKRSESANNDKHNDKSLPSHASQDHSKPNLLKKKLKTNDMPEEKKNDGERIWRQQQKQKQKKQKQDTKLKQLEKGKQKQRQKQVQKQVIEQQKDKKKPFTLKKNRGQSKNNQTQDHHKIQDTKIHQEQQNKKNEQEKKQQISLAGPRMMKFRRKTVEQKQKEVSKQISRQEEKPIQKLVLQTKPIQQQPLKIQQDKPSFVPKRFNLRNRQEKKEQSYIPSIQTKQKEQPKKIQQVVEKKVQQYKPKFNFGDVEDNFKKPLNDPVEKKQAEKIVIPTIDDKKQDEQSKPKFNLRLRDRKKNTEQIGGGGYLPTFSQNKPEQKPTINLNLGKKQTVINQPASKQIVNNSNPPKDINLNKIQNPLNNVKQEPKTNSLQTNSNNSNPYAPKQQTEALDQTPVVNPYAQGGQGVRKKQGPIKKLKIQQQGQKQKINIYEQAQQAEGLNQFVTQPKINKNEAEKNSNYNNPIEKDFNLNDLLGVNKKAKGGDDLADLIGTSNNNKKAKKNGDFFGDLDL